MSDWVNVSICKLCFNDDSSKLISRKLAKVSLKKRKQNHRHDIKKSFNRTLNHRHRQREERERGGEKEHQPSLWFIQRNSIGFFVYLRLIPSETILCMPSVFSVRFFSFFSVFWKISVEEIGICVLCVFCLLCEWMCGEWHFPAV